MAGQAIYARKMCHDYDDYNAGLNRKPQFRKLAYSIGRIHAPNVTALSTLILPVSLQNRIPPSPAEPDCADLIRARYHAHRIDEAVDQGPGDTFAMFGKPWTQSGRHNGCILGLVNQTELLLRLEIGLDVVQERNRQGVALVEVGHVCVEAGFGIFVGEEADIGEFVAED